MQLGIRTGLRQEFSPVFRCAVLVPLFRETFQMGEREMQQRSTFVEIIAWVFIVLSGFGVLIGVIQNFMVFTLFPSEMWAEAATEAREQDFPVAWMFEYFRFFFLALLAVMIAVFIASIGLLRRRNWARLVFIGMMAFGVVWNIGGLVWQWWFISEVIQGQPQPQEFVQEFEMIRRAMLAFGVFMALALSGLFAWIAWKLTRPAIRAEFS